MSEHPFHLHPNENQENIQLIWLDSSICPVQSKLLELNPIALFYTDINQCITRIKSIKDEQIILIVSISFAENILSQIHSYSSLISIFIFSPNNDPQQMDLMNKYKKIGQIYSEYELLIKSIEQTINIIDQQILSFNLFNQKNDYTNDLSQDSTSFLWYQLLIDIFKQIPDNEQINKDILEKYNEYYKKEINQFKNDYAKEKAIQLFNEKHFIRKILTKALRIKDVQLLYLFRYFIIDLYDQIQFTKRTFPTKQTIKLYYGQKLLKTEFDKLNKHIGNLISPTGFLFASLNKTNSITSAKTGKFSTDYQSVLFQIELNPICQEISFAKLDAQQECLFNIDTLFKINSIEFNSSLRIWIINLINNDTNRNIIQTYLQSVKYFTNENSLFIFFGHLLIELDRLNQSEIYFHILLKSLPSDDENIASIYNQIGNFLADKGQLKLALDNYQHAYQIRQKRLSTNHPHIAISLNNIGLIYKDQGKLDEALDYCQKALIIDEFNYPKDHLTKAMTIENIGGIYKEKHLIPNAQTYFLRALNMYKGVLPPNHHFLTDILNSLGKVYCDQGYFDRAFKCYQNAFSICEINSTNDNLQKAQTIENIGLLYKTKGMFDKALEQLFKALDMYQRIHFHPHPDIARCFGYIGLVFEGKNDFNSALDYFNKQLNIDEKCLSIDHENIRIDIQSIIKIYKKKEDFKTGAEFSQKKFEEKSNLLGENHPMVLAILMSMIDLCDDHIIKSNYYKQALSIYEKLIPFDPYATIRCLDAMVKFYFNDNTVREALNYQIQIVQIERQILPNDHIDLALSLQRLGQLYEAVANIDEAEKCYEESRIIFQKHEDNQSKIEYSHIKHSFHSNFNHHKQESNLRKSSTCILQ